MDKCVSVTCRLCWQTLQVTSKAAADFILGTCHKAKGCKEDYVQLADDFAPIRAGRQPGVEVNILPSCGRCFACLLVPKHMARLQNFKCGNNSCNLPEHPRYVCQ
jgi:hypothetical protein